MHNQINHSSFLIAIVQRHAKIKQETELNGTRKKIMFFERCACVFLFLNGNRVIELYKNNGRSVYTFLENAMTESSKHHPSSGNTFWVGGAENPVVNHFFSA